MQCDFVQELQEGGANSLFLQSLDAERKAVNVKRAQCHSACLRMFP